MATTRIIPDAYTEYEDGHIGAVAPSLANIEAKIGGAQGGIPNKLYVLSGPDAKANAKTIFQGGPLLRAIEEAFDAGSSTIYAWRVGSSSKAQFDLENEGGGTGIRLLARNYGSSGNNIQVTVDEQMAMGGSFRLYGLSTGLISQRRQALKVWPASSGFTPAIASIRASVSYASLMLTKGRMLRSLISCPRIAPVSMLVRM